MEQPMALRVFIPLPDYDYPAEIIEYILPGLIESVFCNENGKLEQLINSCNLPNFISSGEDYDVGEVGLRRLMYFDELVGELTVGFHSNDELNFKYMEEILKTHTVSSVELFHRGDKCILQMVVKYWDTVGES
jgi:hypothetical protein